MYQTTVFAEIDRMKKIEDKVANASSYIEQCKPPERVVFLKTHKTGSETLAGILRKFGILNNKSILLGIKSPHLYYPGMVTIVSYF